MNRFEGVKPSTGRIIGCSILALIIGVASIYLSIFQVLMPMPSVSLIMLLSVAFYAWAGWIPAGILLGLSTALAVLLSGLPGVVMLLLGQVPALAVILEMRKRTPFFRQLLRAIVICLGLTVAAVALTAIMMGSDIIAAFMEQVKMIFETQKDSIWQMWQTMFQDVKLNITQEEFFEMYYSAFNMIQTYYQYNLLANLLTGASISAMVSVLWGNWLLARRGEATPDSFRGLCDWYLPANMTFGLLLVLAVSFILAQTSVSGAQTVWVVIEALAQLAFMVQGLAALDRRMKANGSSRGRRTGMFVLLLLGGALVGRIFGLLTIYEILAFAGCASALFGRKGAAKPWIDKIKKDMDDEDR